jgi:hypothetical protein
MPGSSGGSRYAVRPSCRGPHHAPSWVPRTRGTRWLTRLTYHPHQLKRNHETTRNIKRSRCCIGQTPGAGQNFARRVARALALGVTDATNHPIQAGTRMAARTSDSPGAGPGTSGLVTGPATSNAVTSSEVHHAANNLDPGLTVPSNL